MSEDWKEGYRKRISFLLDRGIRGSVENASAAHATILTQEMIKHAQISFYAYAHKMSKEVWSDEVISALQEANSRMVSIRILVDGQCEAIDQNRLPEMLKPMIRRISSKVRKLNNHFSVIDGKALRFETDPEKRTAEFTANDRKSAKLLEDKFKELYVSSEACV